MRISANEGESDRFASLQLDPKISTLIKQLNSQPLLLEKLILNNQQLLLQLAGSSSLKQLQLPLTATEQLSRLVQGHPQNSIQVSISANSKQLVVSFGTTNNSLTTTGETKSVLQQPQEQLTKLYFNQTKLLKTGNLQLSQQISPIFTKQMKTPDLTPQLTLKKAVTDFLAVKPNDNPPLSNNITKLLQQAKNLVTNLNQTSSVKLPQQSMQSILNMSATFLAKPKYNQEMGKLLSLINDLKQNLDFSPENKQLKLQQRVQTSGHFFESKLAASINEITPQDKVKTPNNQTQSTINKPIVENNNLMTAKGNTQNYDLKLIHIQLKQTLRSLLLQVNQSTAIPLNINNLIKLIIQHPQISNILASLDPNQQTVQMTNMSEKAAELTAQQVKQVNQHLITPLLKEQINNPQLSLLINKAPFNVKEAQIYLAQQRTILNEMLSETTNIINKIETNQLLSLKSESPLLQQFLLDLPILREKQIESFELLFESKDENAEKNSNKVWTVTVKFDLEPLGPMFARISLKNQRISTHFFADDKTTAQLLADNIDHLKTSLYAAGLDIDEVTGQQGIVPNELLVNDGKTLDILV